VSPRREVHKTRLMMLLDFLRIYVLFFKENALFPIFGPYLSCEWPSQGVTTQTHKNRDRNNEKVVDDRRNVRMTNHAHCLTISTQTRNCHMQNALLKPAEDSIMHGSSPVRLVSARLGHCQPLRTPHAL